MTTVRVNPLSGKLIAAKKPLNWLVDNGRDRPCEVRLRDRIYQGWRTRANVIYIEHDGFFWTFRVGLFREEQTTSGGIFYLDEPYPTLKDYALSQQPKIKR